MTVVALASVKGAPGATTLACLLGATWPGPRPAIVVECDPSGGDLAPRFQLSTRIGWSSFVTGARRVGPGVAVTPHLQQLPGGLDVLVGPRAGDDLPEAGVDWLVDGTGTDGVSGSTDPDVENGRSWDLIVDLGRLLPAERSSAAWSRHAQWLVVVLRSDPASAWAVRQRASGWREQWGERVGLAVVAGGEHAAAEIASFTGLPVLGEVPSDPAAARVASGERGSGRRLARSPLVGSASALAQRLAGRAEPAEPAEPAGPAEPAEPAELAGPARPPGMTAPEPLSTDRQSVAAARHHLDRLRRHLRRGQLEIPVEKDSPIERTSGSTPIPTVERRAGIPGRQVAS